mmetsp:Transcript_6329/g.13976  ORF Transcript_6329/g.13976 Transcript_6329/m.13976 type:complete len:202 (-) Transcript_6329:138-743(-)
MKGASCSWPQMSACKMIAAAPMAAAWLTCTRSITWSCHTMLMGGGMKIRAFVCSRQKRSTSSGVAPPLLVSTETMMALAPASLSTPPMISGGGIPTMNPVFVFLLYSGKIASVPVVTRVVFWKCLGGPTPSGLACVCRNFVTGCSAPASSISPISLSTSFFLLFLMRDSAAEGLASARSFVCILIPIFPIFAAAKEDVSNV